MKRVSRKMWAEALESGKYKQTKNSLKKKDNFCCLGVLCDLAGAKWEKDLNEVTENYKCSFEKDDIKYYPGDNIPEVLQRVFNVDEEEANEIGITLINMNDSGKKFKSIAKFIREYQVNDDK